MPDDPSEMEDTARAMQLLAQSETALAEILVAFDLMAERLKSDGTPSDVDMAKLYQNTSQARSRLINEVKEHEKRTARAEGLDASAPLDLDAIQCDIGRRLDRIRAARGAERFPRSS